ncbi:MAG: M48 family metalloprotease [Arenimonas sp.]|nr:M48 family metalloprotease [Arenimonas sp.]
MNAPRILALALLLAMASPAEALSRFGQAEDLLKLGKRAVDATQPITEEDEVQLGRGIAANVLGAAPLVRDDGLQRYVNQVGLWLAMQTDRASLPWRFGVIDSPSVNAFALPGGTVLITRGLYDSLRDEGELAGVLAHEIAHVVERHQVKAIQKAMGRDFATEIAGEAAGRSDNVLVQRFGSRAFSVGTEVLTRGLDKKDEFQADQRGMVIAARAGYNPFGLAGVLQTLDTASAQDEAVALLFATHPAPAARLERLDATVGERLDAYATVATPGRLYRPK